MDLQTLSTLFATTYNPDPDVRKSAELQIRKVGGEEGMVAALLQIIATDNVDLATRQACAVYLKNRVQNGYQLDHNRGRPDYMPIAASDRTALKSSILRLLAASPSRSITLQLGNTLKTLIARDFPDQWSGVLDDVKILLQSTNIREVGAGCVAALECVRAFRFSQKNDTLPGIVSQLFPILVNIATQMLSTPPSTSQEIPTMLHLILKTYKTSILIHLSKHQQSAESLVPWGRLLFQVVNLQIPKEAVPEDEDERERSEWWKAKKWAYNTLGRLFHRYGNPSQLPSLLKKEYADFAQHFVTNFAPEIFKIYLNQVELYVSGQSWLSKKCQDQIFVFFTECVKPKSTWELLKPHFQTLVSSFVFPQLSFTPAKKEIWEHDPVDFVRVFVDEYETVATPASSATTFLFALASNRTKASFKPILGFINTVLQSHAPAPQRYGALNMAAALAPFMMRHPEVKANIEQFMVQHVLPEFASTDPYMRLIACEVVANMEKANVSWSNVENLNSHFRAVATMLDDPEFPVRVLAALALTEMVQNHESVKTAVAPQVGKVIQDLLKLADETDLDILNHSMEVMVHCFQDELLPVAAQLTARLCESYMRLAKESMSPDEPEGLTVDIESVLAEGDDDKTYAAMGVAKTIGTVASSVESSPEILKQVQEVIVPVVIFTLENKLLDLFDNMYDLVDSLTFKLHSISPSMWPVFELTYKLFKSEAVDFLDEMLPSLDNFVSYGIDVFKARAEYRQMVLDIYVTSMTSEQLGENDRVNGCKLAESILLNLRGHADETLQTIIVTALDQLDKGETSAFRLANLEVLVNAVLYNASAALHLMEASRPGMARTFFDKWFVAINAESGLPRVHDKKLCILALCALLEMNPNTIPDTLRDGWAGIVAGILAIFKDLPRAVEARKALEEAFQEDSDEEAETGEGFLNLEDDDGDVWDEDSAYLELLANEGARLRQKSEGRAVAPDEDDETSVESDIEEELGYFSPLDNVNPYVTFKQALTNFQMQNGPSYQGSTAGLNVEQQTLLMEVMRIASLPTSGDGVIEA